jgi:superfamily II DNA or RNA helicase
MMSDEEQDALLEMIAQSILDASDEEILRVATERGVDVAALQDKVRRMVRAAARPDTVQTLAIGDVVALRSDPSRRGVVTAVTTTNRETRCSVFIDGRIETLYASQLVSADLTSAPVLAGLEEFQAALTALQLTAPSLQNLYSLQAGRIDFIPYQFRPVLKFIRADRPRLLLADEVGVGKTIEAGLLLRELQARRPLRSVLIICSKALVVEEKWQNEMRRFDEEFRALDGKELRYCIDQTDLEGEWPDRFSRAIVPFSLFNEGSLLGAPARTGRASPGLLTLEAPPRFDLLIVDEAHNARNSDTHLHQGLRLLADNAEAVVLITATPIQLGAQDLFSMLNLLRPDLVIDRPTFERMAEPNPAINEAVAHIRGGELGWQEVAMDDLDEAARTEWGRSILAGSPEFCSVRADVVAAHTDEARVRLVHRAEGLHSFASMISRTRRRDIGDFTSRRPQTVETNFTPAQAELHAALLTAQARILARVHGDAPLGFLMSTIRRQASSSLHGLRPFLEDLLTRRLSELDFGQEVPDGDGLSDEVVDPLRQEVADVIALAERLPADDPKLERLAKIVAEKSAMSNPRLLIFSSFRHTIRYLERALLTRGTRVGVIHGDVPDDERRRLRAAFAAPSMAPDAIDVLLSSEVGSEGLDFQFCDAIVNYDIPWNPMRIEQRIGRIDRYGQRSPTVAIYNMVTPGTVDFDIYMRCLLRIGIFERAIGGSEAILGEISNRIQHVAEDFTLSEPERQARLQQLADNELRDIAESEALEERQAELFGVRFGRQQFEDEVAAASSLWLRPEAIERLVNLYLERKLGMGRTPILGQAPAKTLRLAAEARRRLSGPRRGIRNNLAEREWEAWLRGDQPTLGVTFEREAALEDRSLTFITPVHPLTQAAAALLSADDEVNVALAVRDGDVAPGQHPFAIYQWTFSGLKEDALLVPVVADAEVRRRFMDLLAAARAVEVALPEPSILEALDGWHHELWMERLALHTRETADIAAFRRKSLAVSHTARMVTLREQLGRTQEGRIQRMRTAQISRAEADYHEALAGLRRAEGRADILARRVASGVLIVEEA